MNRLTRIVPTVSMLLALTGGASAQASGAADGWKTYVNVRFRYQVCYPAALLKPQGEADNGDGQEFKAADGGRLAVWGSNNAMDQTLSDAVKMNAEDLTGKAGKVSYRVIRPGWAVISGDDGGRLDFYSKIILRDDQLLVFELKYPKTAAARYKPVVDRLAHCFQPAH
jgi:hypothetical protein